MPGHFRRRHRGRRFCPSCQSVAVDFEPKSPAISAHPVRLGGVSRSSRTLVRDAVDAAATQRKHFARTSSADADGEVVWS